jgi:hypothetical protein
LAGGCCTWRYAVLSVGGAIGGCMGRKRAAGAAPVVYRTARCGLRVTRGQRRRLFGLLRSAGDVWCCVLELNAWRRRRQDRPLACYRELCRELAASGPGTFGELDSAGARSVLRRYCDAWFTCQVPGCRDVTPGAGPHHGQRPRVPWPAPARPHTTRWTRSRSPNTRGARKNVTPDELTSRCTKPKDGPDAARSASR